MKIVIAMIFFMFSLIGYSQSSAIGVGIGGFKSKLVFINTDGIRSSGLEGAPTATASFYYQSTLSPDIYKRKRKPATLISIEVGLKSSKIRNKESNVLTTWSMQYLSGNFMLQRRANSSHVVNVTYGGGISVAHFVSGTQIKGFQQFDLTEEMVKINIGGIAEIGVTYTLSEYSYGLLKFSYLRGLTNIEQNQNQKAFLHDVGISAAVFFKIKRK